MSPNRTVPSILILGTLALAQPGAAPSSHWPGWRGPGSRAVSDEAGLPREWSPTLNVAWKTAVPGRGHSSPIVWGNRLFVTAAIDGEIIDGKKPVTHVEAGEVFVHPDSVGGDRRHAFKVFALDAGTGRVLWERTPYEGPVYDDIHKRGSYAAPTPVTDGERVYAYFGSEGLYAYDYAGTLVWKISVGGIATFGMGTATSPVLYQLQPGALPRTPARSLAGTPAPRAAPSQARRARLGPADGAPEENPMPVERQGAVQTLVILQCDEDTGQKSFIVAFDARTGEEVWRTPREVQASWSTPVVVPAGDRMELVTSGSEFVIAYDPATGKEVWRTEGVKSNAIATPLMGHGLVIASAGFPRKRVIAIRPGGSGDITGTDRVAWTYEKGTAYVSSPILYGDYVYLTNDQGLLTCLDAKTGKVVYEGGRVPAPAMFFASMVAFDGMLLQSSEDGDMFLVKAGPTHEIIGTNSIGEPLYASPAIANGRLYVRGLNHVFAIGH